MLRAPMAGYIRQGSSASALAGRQRVIRWQMIVRIRPPIHPMSVHMRELCAPKIRDRIAYGGCLPDTPFKLAAEIATRSLDTDHKHSRAFCRRAERGSIDDEGAEYRIKLCELFEMPIKRGPMLIEQ